MKRNDKFVYKGVESFAFEKVFCNNIVDKVFVYFSLVMKR